MAKSKSISRLEAQLREMEQKIPFLGSEDPQVSKVPVAWHLAHNLKVINSILKGITQSDPTEYKKEFSWKKELVYFTGRIPRGKARAPELVVPEDHPTAGELQQNLENARTGIHTIQYLPENAFFQHPYFGHIRRDETAKFLVIHTEHHLKIIRDILK